MFAIINACQDFICLFLNQFFILSFPEVRLNFLFSPDRLLAVTGKAIKNGHVCDILMYYIYALLWLLHLT